MAAANKYCYFPNGDLVSMDSPCFPNEKASPCCGLDSGWTCLKNGLCYSKDLQRVGRGSCTDRDWDSPNCPQYCTKNEFNGAGARDFSNHGVPLWACSNQWAATGGLMCCDISANDDPEVLAQHNRSCCPGVDAINLFTMGSKLGTATSITLSSSASPFSTLATSRSKTASPFASPSISSIPNSSISLIPNSTLSSSLESSSTAGSSTSKQPTSTGRPIGIAVGTSAGAVALAVAGYLIYRRRKQRRRAIGRRSVVEPQQDHMTQIYDPKEMPGDQGHELPANSGYIAQELPAHSNPLPPPKPSKRFSTSHPLHRSKSPLRLDVN